MTATGVARRSGDVILSLDNISLSFGGVKALTDISFDVREHEIRAIIGPNGAGKSSMLNVINGVYRPQQGRITFKGETRAHMEPRLARYKVPRSFERADGPVRDDAGKVRRSGLASDRGATTA